MLQSRTVTVGANGGGNHPQLVITRRNLPHWSMDGAWYYITFCVQSGVMHEAEVRFVLDHIKSGHPRFYRLIAACVMPDHVHTVLCPRERVSLSRIMNGIKAPTARFINRRRGSNGAFWQDERWDRIIRNEAELDEKLRYMLDNPVKEGLVENPWDYHGWYMNHE